MRRLGRAVSKFLHLVQSVTTMKCPRDCESNIVLLRTTLSVFPEIDEKEMRICECQFVGCTRGDKRQGLCGRFLKNFAR